MSKSPIRVVLVVFVFGLASLLISGCLGPQNNATTQNKKKMGKTKLVCHRDAPTGSHLPQTICYQKADVKVRRDNDREKVRTLQIGGAIKRPTPNQ